MTIEEIKEKIDNEEDWDLDTPEGELIDILLNKLDKEYLIKIIENPRLRRKLGISNRDISPLIMATEDPKYIESCIRDKRKIIECKISSSTISQMLMYRSPDEIKQYLEDDNNLMFLNVPDIRQLIIATGDVNYIKHYVEDAKSRTRVGLTPRDISIIIAKTKDDLYIRKFIETSKKDEIGLTSPDLLYLIGEINKEEFTVFDTIGDVSYAKRCIEKHEEIGLNQEDVRKLIVAIGENKYTKTFIEDIEKREKYGFDPINVFELIRGASTVYQDPFFRMDANTDKAYLESCINRAEELKLNTQTIKFIFTELINNPKYIKEFVLNKPLWTKLGFNTKDIRDLILRTEDIKTFIEDEELRNTLGLNGCDCSVLISQTNDVDYIKKYAQDKERQEKLKFDQSDIDRLTLCSGNKEDIEKRLQKIEEEQLEDDVSQIDLPEDMTIGIEIESEGNQSIGILNLTDLIGKGWGCKADGSLEEGVEVVSPILTGNTEESSKQIKRVCKRLKGLRTRSIWKMWWTCTYRCKSFNNS